MFGIVSISLFFAILQVVTSELPEECKRLPPGVENPHDCCKMPHIFEEEDFKECGIEDPSWRKIKEPDCSKHTCLLKKHSLTKDDESVDKEAVGAFLDKWADANSDFKDAVGKAKEKCLSGDLPGPPEICEANKIAFCFMVTIFHDCPNWEDSDNCKKVKEHLEKCRKFLPF